MTWQQRARLRFALARLAWRYLDDGDSWRALPHDVPMTWYGSGNLVDDFRAYLQGPSRVAVTSPEQIGAWLRTCEYVRDPVLFGRDDYWQHPAGFEELRRGDCEDHALWAWRKLVELGYDAELIAGQSPWIRPDHDGFHAWVTYTENGTRFLFEAAAKSEPQMIRPLSDAGSEYHPHASVDGHLQRRLYAGYVRWLRAELDRRRAARKARRNVAT